MSPRASTFSRKKSGCLACRLRKKKCDERKPRCQSCERNYLLCTWPLALPEPNNLWRHSRLLEKHLDVETLPTVACSETPEHYAHNLDPRTNTEGNTEEQSFLNSTNTTQGAPFSISIGLNLLKPRDWFHLTLSKPASRTLFQHYESRTADLLCASQGLANPFMSLLIPLAATHEPILQCILALSGVHYLNHFRGVPSSDIIITTWSHYALAIRGLKHGITRMAYGEQEILPLLIATLLFCFVESTRGDVGSIAQHLMAARTFLISWLQQRQAKLEVELRGFIVEFYLYIAVLSNTQLGPAWTGLVIKDCSWFYGGGTTDCTSWGMFFGYAKDLFGIIPLVSDFAHRSNAEKEEPASKSFDTVATYHSLLIQVQSWRTPEAGDPALVVCGRIFQQSLLLLLHASFYRDEIGSVALNNPLDQGVLEFVVLLESLPVASPIATTISWPLAIAGSCARSESHRTIIRQRLKMLYERFTMENITAVMRVLEALWASGHCGPLHITTVMQQRNDHFIIQ